MKRVKWLKWQTEPVKKSTWNRKQPLFILQPTGASRMATDKASLLKHVFSE